MSEHNNEDIQISEQQSKQKQSQNQSMEIIKKYLLKKTQNRYKLRLSDQQAFKWKFNQNKNNKLLPTFKLLKKQTKKQCFSWQDIQIQDLKQYSFPVLKYKTMQLTQFSLLILKSNTYFQNQIKDEQLLRKLVTEISLNYNIVSYHNFSHAFSLSLLLFQCFQYHTQLNKIFTDQDKFYAILAGLAHDLNHPGNNNAYQVKMKSKLAIQANNESVLQKFHIKQLWNILDKNLHINILNKIPNSSIIKQKITYLILMTDVAQHFKNLDQLKLKKKECDDQNKNFLDLPQNKQFFLGQLFHACDISNPCIDFQNYITWAALLSYQFNEQTRLQQQHQIQVTEMLKYKDLKTFYKGQLGFINFLVMPLWKEIVSICNNLKIFTDNVEQNIKTLNYMIQNVKQQDEIIKQKNLRF